MQTIPFVPCRGNQPRRVRSYHEPVIGSVLDGRYRVLRFLGRGGAGEVYLVEHLQLRRQEALKVLKPAVAARADLAARFRREARAAGRVAHPNIVAIYDLGRLSDGRLYLTMEYAEGETLEQIVCRAGPLPVPRALGVLAQLARAVDHAHSLGVIHRDLKPGNLLLAAEARGGDHLKILDFGVAKVVAADYADSVGTTRDGLPGTPRTMAPERLTGRGEDRRSDLYSIGCIAFEILTGQPPFSGAPLEVLRAQVNEPASPPSARLPEAGIPAEVDALVLRCLAKDPAERYQSGAELAAALRLVAGPEAVEQPAPEDR